jgi:hypothetical protein
MEEAGGEWRRDGVSYLLLLLVVTTAPAIAGPLLTHLTGDHDRSRAARTICRAARHG